MDQQRVEPENIGPITLTGEDIHPGSGNRDPFLVISEWGGGVSYFVGRNGSGKSRTGRALASKVPGALLLSADRLTGIMGFRVHRVGFYP